MMYAACCMYVCVCVRVLFERIVNYPAKLSEADVREAISNAFHVWSDVSRLTFQERRSGDADILIQFCTGFHDDRYPFDGPGESTRHQSRLFAGFTRLRGD